MKYPIFVSVLTILLVSGCMSSQEYKSRGVGDQNVSGENQELSPELAKQVEKFYQESNDSLEKKLLHALFNKNLAQIRSLLSSGADPNKGVYGFAYRMEDGEKVELATYPLFHVAQTNRITIEERKELLTVLKDGGLDLNLRNDRGFTAIDIVLSIRRELEDKIELLKWFLENGADPNLRRPEIELEDGTKYRMDPHLIQILYNDDYSLEEKKEIITLFINNGADPDIKNDRGRTPLYALASGIYSNIENELELAEFFLDLGADPDIPSIRHVYNSTKEINEESIDYPLLAALRAHDRNNEEKSQMIRLLLSAGADPNCTDESNYSFFYYLIGNTDLSDYLEMVKLAVEKGADPSIKSDTGRHVLSSAYWERSKLEERGIELTDLFRTLVSAGADLDMTDDDGRTILFKAAFDRNKELLTWLIRNGADTRIKDKEGSTVLHEVFESSYTVDLDIVKLLLREGVDVNAGKENGETALFLAAKNDDNHEAVRYLLDHGAEINISNENEVTALGIARQLGCKKNAEYLAGKGGVPYISRFPVGNKAAVCKAVLAGDLRSIRTMQLDEFSKVVARTEDGVPASALHLAVEGGDMRVIRALCDRKVDWNIGDRYGRTPLQLAVAKGRRDIVGRLLDAGADPHLKDDYWVTAIGLAAAIRPDISEYFLSRRVYPEDDRPGICALWNGNLDLVKTYAEYTEWIEGDVDLAAALGHEDVVRYLSTHIDLAKDKVDELLKKATESRRSIEAYESEIGKRLRVPKKYEGIAKKRGNFTWTVESYSPWMEELAEGKKLEDYPVGVYIPEDYDPSKSYGLLISMIHAKSGNQYPRPEFRKILDKYDILWVGFDPYNGIFVPFEDNHECLALAGVYNMLAYFNIDKSRIYMAGFSWGGKLTGEIVPKQAGIFSGGIAIDGCFTTKNRLVRGLDYGRENITMVLCSGDFDYNRKNTYSGYSILQSLGYKNCHFIQQPLKGHAIISAENFEKAIRLLDE